MKKYLLTAAVSLTLLTADAQWLVQDPGFRNDSLGFYEMSLPNRHTAWAVCYDGWFGLLSGKPILNFTRTTNGGATWTPGKVGTDRTLRFSNISAINGQEAWVAMHKMDYATRPTLGYVGFGKGGGIFHTKNGGLTWEHTEPGELFDNNSTPQFVHFKNKNHGIAVGDPKQGYWEIYLTNNKGKKWKRVPSKDIPAPIANEKGWISGYSVIGHTIWFGTSAGRMYKSTDFGKKWKVYTVTTLPATEVNEIAFLDDGLHGVAHLRNNTIFRTYVLSTSDGGLTWTNYQQPANWKNSRITAVPGTNAFISTAVHNNPQFQGSAISYDAGQTWTEIDNAADKAVCRFYDAHTGYAGGFYITGHPVLGVGGMFKSGIVFQDPSCDLRTGEKLAATPQSDGIPGKGVQVYPSPATDHINISIDDKTINTMHVVSIISMNGKVLESRKTTGKLIRMDVSRIPSGSYMVRITGGEKIVNKLIAITR